MKVWGHRGFSGNYPENTMLAFKKAEECGCDGVEMDVHLSLDGKVVVIHDESLKRTTGVDKMVGDLSFKELTSLNAPFRFTEFGITPIPSFEEFCDFLSKNTMEVNVEIKSSDISYPGLEKKVCDILKSFNLVNRTIISSFNWLSVIRCKELLPEVRTGLLYSSVVAPRHLSYLASELKIDYLHPDYHLVNDEMIKECKENGVGINTWTVNDERECRNLKERGVSGVISNYPDMCLKVREN